MDISEFCSRYVKKIVHKQMLKSIGVKTNKINLYLNLEIFPPWLTLLYRFNLWKLGRNMMVTAHLIHPISLRHKTEQFSMYLKITGKHAANTQHKHQFNYFLQITKHIYNV